MPIIRLLPIACLALLFSCDKAEKPQPVKEEQPQAQLSNPQPRKVAETKVLSDKDKSRRAAKSEYEKARESFRTELLHKVAAPQDYPATEVPPDTEEMTYRSGELDLKAWISKPKDDGSKHPAVVFLHGGFAFSNEDWVMAKPYRDAGFVVMMPLVRGENGGPGVYTLFLHEVDDAASAVDFLIAQPYVDPERTFAAGHSVGGTLAMLLTMKSEKLAAGASFSGSPDQVKWTANQMGLVPFNPDIEEEFRMRSPLSFPSSFKCPMVLFHGSREGFFKDTTAELARRATETGCSVTAETVTGDHMSHVPEAMNRSIKFFESTFAPKNSPQ